jgi:hypothetical protein
MSWHWNQNQTDVCQYKNSISWSSLPMPTLKYK